ncbi:sugar isomerase domain-containing protein [Anaerorhabdus furcosa]|uniref:Uncharacterized protein, contains SIS (Sugar ISomerase) phosphosugar binding domain n=1 Tax=Anaerorhabdus furcosa TaxID=118967 RepID=A0A1T4MWE3_9FIRM|nr:SIS domain-containing protein [Anaerorhabdus furcosa]SJZ71410.1 Uncharacterized protein, contains SIS (Sugar ISomerase) phosphosugar binding domain [Anaerorhabdus furcosa]
MNPVFETVKNLIDDVERTQQEAIEKASIACADAIEKGGMLQAFGSGHSEAGAMEVAHRAGGFIPTKKIVEPARGSYEGIEGVGTNFMKKVDIRDTDVVFIISNSGRNPLPIEIAIGAKKKGAVVICVTALEASKKLTSKHSGGKNLYQLSDIILDNRVPDGDCGCTLEGYDSAICGMSMITTSVIIQAITYRTAEILISRGITPPIYKSQNIDGGREFNESLEAKYFDRLYRI